MPNEVIMRKWVDALRSGEYSQTTGVLKKISIEGDTRLTEHCCLGVLCEIAAVEGVVVERSGEKMIFSDVPYRVFSGPDLTDSQVALLPASVVKWAGFLTESPWGVAVMNDNGASFTEIADLIEQKTLSA